MFQAAKKANYFFKGTELETFTVNEIDHMQQDTALTWNDFSK